jgi:NAD(P)-dependent dehydrogenase (short-subunit alcohol dehydrogenase family)
MSVERFALHKICWRRVFRGQKYANFRMLFQGGGFNSMEYAYSCSKGCLVLTISPCLGAINQGFMLQIVVTGASRGIGWDLVRALAAVPGRRILALSRNGDRLAMLAQECRRDFPGSEVLVYPLDLGQPLPADFDSFIARHLGRVDVLVHNAGLLVHKPFEQLERADWLRIFDANVFGAAELSRTLLPWLCKSARPHVLHIGSMGGFQGSSKFLGLSAYSASKAALACLTECLAEEWKPLGVAVNCLALGAVQTRILQEAFPGYQAPLDSVEMGAYIAHFAVEGHRFFNGKVLPVSLSTP